MNRDRPRPPTPGTRRRKGPWQPGACQQARSRGGHRADAVGDAGRAAALRLKAGALLYQAGKFVAADALLTQVAEDFEGGQGPGEGGVCSAAWHAAGRWRWDSRAIPRPLIGPRSNADRGVPRRSRDRRGPLVAWQPQARALSSATPRCALGSDRPAHSRWLDARIAVARLHQDDLENLRIGNDKPLLAKHFAEAREFLTTSVALVNGPEEKTESGAGVGPAGVDARFRPSRRGPHDLRSGRAERPRPPVADRGAGVSEPLRRGRTARPCRDRAVPARRDARTARLLDSIATSSESDLRQRRFGLFDAHPDRAGLGAPRRTRRGAARGGPTPANPRPAPGRKQRRSPTVAHVLGRVASSRPRPPAPRPGRRLRTSRSLRTRD